MDIAITVSILLDRIDCLELLQYFVDKRLCIPLFYECLFAELFCFVSYVLLLYRTIIIIIIIFYMLIASIIIINCRYRYFYTITIFMTKLSTCIIIYNDCIENN